MRPPLFFLWRTRTIMSLNGWVAGELSSPLDPAPRRTRRTVRSDLLEREGPDYEECGLQWLCILALALPRAMKRVSIMMDPFLWAALGVIASPAVVFFALLLIEGLQKHLSPGIVEEGAMKMPTIKFIFQTDGRTRAEVTNADGVVLVRTPDFLTRKEAHDALVEVYRQISPWFYWTNEDDCAQLEEDILEEPLPRPFRR